MFLEDGQNLWIYDLQDDSLSPFTLVGTNGSAAWSPDGKWIAFQSIRDGMRGIYRMPSDGGGPAEQLNTQTTSAQQPTSWSPDGSVLAFMRSDSDVDVVTLPLEGDTGPQDFVASLSNECCAMFSPDGKWLSYVSNETGLAHVYVSPFSEPDVKWLVSGEEGGTQPVWSPDGKELFYRSGNQMMVVPIKTQPTLDAGKPRVLFEGPYRSSAISLNYQYYDIDPDGQRFLMIKEDREAGQINVVLNWFEELKRLVPTN